VRLLILTENREAVSHHRILQFLPELAQHGHRFRILPFSTVSQPVGFALFRAWLHRLWHCLQVRHYDLVWVEGAWLPGMPWPLAQLLRCCLPRMRVIDSRDPADLETLLGSSNLITLVTRNEDTSREHNTLVLPWAVARVKQRPAGKSGRLLLGWPVQQATAEDWQRCKQLLAGLDVSDFQVQVLGGRLEKTTFDVSSCSLPGGAWLTEHCPWDIALFPKTNNRANAGMAELNLLRCLALGIPVLVDKENPISSIVEAARAGYVIDEPQQWLPSIQRLWNSAELRETLGDNGRDWVRLYHCREKAAAVLLAFLKRQEGSSGPGRDGPGLANAEDSLDPPAVPGGLDASKR